MGNDIDTLALTGTEAPVAMVTGASRGIGACVAIRLASDGYHVFVNYRDFESSEAAAGVVRRIASTGGQATAFRADVTDEAQVDEMVSAAESSFGPVAVLVNNAAIGMVERRPWNTLEYDDWADVLRVNVIAAFACARRVAPEMQASEYGSIVNMSSITALIGSPMNLDYVTSKAALIGLTRSLARELGPSGVRVNAAIIGAIATPEESVLGSPDDLRLQVLAAQSIKRRGTPTDVAGLVSFLASRDAAFITGQCIAVDGGWTMP
jgi:3-oxoacyl-[acyl-carrier protein] reductase